MQKGITDIHTHSAYSFDSQEQLEKMLESAYQKGVLFFGTSEHFDYDQIFLPEFQHKRFVDEDAYFHAAHHLQEDYEGAMHYLVGVEFGYSDAPRTHARYQQTIDERHPDYIINSMHTLNGEDYSDYSAFYRKDATGKKVLRERMEVFREYLGLVRRSLDVAYAYDVVGHFGYIARYSPYEEKGMPIAELQEEIDDILRTIIAKGKILEINSSTKDVCIPPLPIVKRYYQLGGRMLSFGSDSHDGARIADKYEEICLALKEIGFTYFTVPFKGEYIKVEM